MKALSANPLSAGLYSAAQNIAIIVYFGMSAMGQALFPNISRLASTGLHEKARQLISDSFGTFILILLPFATLLFQSAPLVMQLLFGKSYLAGVSSLKLLTIAYAMLAIFALFANVLNGAGRTRWPLVFSGVGAAITLVVSILLVPRFGITGAAIASCAGAAISATGVLFASYSVFRYNLPIRVVLAALGGVLIMYFGASISKMPIWLLVIWYMLLLLMYFFWLMLCRVPSVKYAESLASRAFSMIRSRG